MKFKELISKEKLEARIKELGEQITKDYNGETVTFICILRGSVIFTVELAMQVKSNVRFEFMEVSSYEGTESTGKINIKKDISKSIEGENIIIVEDIIDTGRTLKYLREYLQEKNPKSIKICSLLDKPSRREVQVDADYVGFEIENKFIVGFGLDIDQDYRNLPYIGYVE